MSMTSSSITFGTQENHTLHVMDGQRVASRSSASVRRLGRTGPDGLCSIGWEIPSAARHTVVGGGDATAIAFINREEFFPYGETSFGSFGRKRYRFAARSAMKRAV